jgi:small subunit ribosomal protein S7|uniref:Ribosomal protein S7 n=1 Tax=Scherffelia dubia TaxID=3190 RepID=A0A142BYA0_SCHDU|nr:ribosomal protein S7 [Scherffelia dubia]AMP43392.1 ribosomal protein S7 [Scherffelia dubia]
MSRRHIAKKRVLSPDPIYNSRLVHMMTNRLMKSGKKGLAFRLIYEALKNVGQTTQQDPIKIMEQAVRNATPFVEVKSRRIGGSTFQVPLEVGTERGTTLAISWLLSSCRNRSGKDTVTNLTNEILDASKNMGNAIRKRDEVHKMAEANKAFAKYRF